MTVQAEDLADVVDRSASRDPLGILTDQDASRIPELVPVRHDRMSANPFTFYRGAAAVMASDLAATPHSGVITQLCGDAHLSNFGMFNSPERRMVFDLNDFDETHPGPFEWDVKRLAASMVVAAQENGFDERTARSCAKAAAKTYRRTMQASADKTGLASWYDNVAATDISADIGDRFDTAGASSTQRMLKKAKHRDSAQALSKLCYFDLAGAHIKSDPPLLVPAEEAIPSMSRNDLHERFTDGFERYAQTLPDHVATLFGRYSLIEAARKVVGVGSVGTRCWIALFSGPGTADPLFLQFNEAKQSVLAEYVPGYAYDQEGRRVVFGQQLLQASSDIFLGWVSTRSFAGVSADFYVRQLRDGKGSVVTEALSPKGMKYYGRLCGEVLAQAHARTAARNEIAGYLAEAGKAFDQAIADFSLEYSRLNAADHVEMVEAIERGAMSAASL
ncbi:DUF2252 domain-containing protein [Gordonia zhaorongruii]|uniref:DUF2252 domain-containing protein n=1 Tax=Gordonia zhaorongruii TaxID=2597659 RepID=UPI00104FE1CF|nr:DUF2252 domain-containing protein [Gordonia zhaorongruii]